MSDPRPVALVTGASSGMGREIARELARSHRVVAQPASHSGARVTSRTSPSPASTSRFAHGPTGRGADPDLEHRADLGGAQPGHLGQLGGDAVDRVVEPDGVEVDLQPVAGGHHDAPVDRHVGSHGEVADGSAEQRRVDGEPVQLRQLEVVVAGTENHEHDTECYRRDGP